MIELAPALYKVENVWYQISQYIMIWNLQFHTKRCKISIPMECEVKAVNQTAMHMKVNDKDTSKSSMHKSNWNVSRL